MSNIIVTGRVGSDCEVRKMQDGTPVASFSVADEIGFGEKKRVQWIKCSLFGKRAESVAPYILKGGLVEVIGTPSIHTYETKGGEHRAELQVRVSDVRLHGGGKKDQPVADNAPATRRDDIDQDIPF